MGIVSTTNFKKFKAFREYRLMTLRGVLAGFGDNTASNDSQRSIEERYTTEKEELESIKNWENVLKMTEITSKLNTLYGDYPKERDGALLQLSNEYFMYSKFGGAVWQSQICGVYQKYLDVLPNPTWTLEFED